MTVSEDTVARTPEEILARIEAIADADFLGWSRKLLIGYLPFEDAKPFLKDGVTAEEWEPSTTPRADLLSYLSFAWEKANDERGISASRSVDKIEQWLWLMGDDELLEAFRAAPYPMYGKPRLRVVTAALCPEKLESLSEEAPDDSE